MRPLMASTSEDSFTASGKSPVMCVKAVRKRLPKLWPLSPRPDSKRYWNKRESRASSSDSATMQFRMSPGGSTSNSRLSRPELPPSSVTVTTAAMSRHEGSLAADVWSGTYCFKPCSSTESPVPPPIATTCSGSDGKSLGLGGCTPLIPKTWPRAQAEPRYCWCASGPPALTCSGLLRKQQLLDLRLVDHAGEVGVLARTDAVARLQVDCAFEIFMCAVDVP